jgi:hypothetical protein
LPDPSIVLMGLSLALSAEVDRRPTVRIDDAALITPAAGDLVGVPPEVPELGSIPADNEQCRRRTKRIPTLAGRG